MEKQIETELAVFDPIVSGLNTLKEQALTLKVADCNDSKGYQEVKTFRTQSLVKLRTTIEKKRVEIKGFYLEAGRAIDTKANDIKSEIQKLEDLCKSQEKIVDDEIARKKAEDDARKKALLDGRIAKLQAVKAGFSVNDLINMSEDTFLELLDNETNRFEQEEMDRITKEKELAELRAKQLEADRLLEIERKKTEKANAELVKIQQAELKKRDAENAKLAKEKAEIEKKNLAEAKERDRVAKNEETKRIFNEKLKAQAEERARKEVADKKLFDSIKTNFPTLEVAWVEIARLTKLQTTN